MKYMAEVTSVTGFIQLLAQNYVRHGYWFYVTGFLPKRCDPGAFDRKITDKYRLGLSATERARRKQRGEANLLYLRHEQFFAILATAGKHAFLKEENAIRDIRLAPLIYAGYSVSVVRGNFLRKVDGVAEVDGRYRVRTQIARTQLDVLRKQFTAIALHRSKDALAREIFNLPYEPYAPVRKQLLGLVFMVNKIRKAAGYEPLPTSCIRYHRRIVQPRRPLEDCTLEAGLAVEKNRVASSGGTKRGVVKQFAPVRKNVSHQSKANAPLEAVVWPGAFERA